jgi:hypothetical protein
MPVQQQYFHIAPAQFFGQGKPPESATDYHNSGFSGLVDHFNINLKNIIYQIFAQI